MAEPLSIDLSPSGAIAAPGSSDVVDLGERRSVVVLTVRLKSITGSGRLKVTLETSDDETDWQEAETLLIEQGFGQQRFGAHSLSRYVRFAWTLDGVTSVDFEASGEAHVVYCSPVELKTFGLPEIATQRASVVDLVEQCIAATDEAAGHLAAAYTLPLVGWGRDLRLHSAKMATRYILDCIGWQPEGPEDPIEKAFDRAIKWLGRIASGLVRPPEIVDSAPEVFEAGSVVVSRGRRETRWA